MRIRSSLAALGMLASTPAFAHIGRGEAHDAMHGFLHPLTGLDHILAMVTVGALAAHLGGRALWAVPAAFLAAMAVGGVLGMAGGAPPAIDFVIAITVVALGGMLAARIRAPTALAMGLVGLFAVAHGFAHGAELPEGASGLPYAFGFIAATALLHASGVAAGLVASRSGAIGATAMRIGGLAVAVAGIALMGSAL